MTTWLKTNWEYSFTQGIQQSYTYCIREFAAIYDYEWHIKDQNPILIDNLLNKLWVAHFGSLSGSKTDVSLKKKIRISKAEKFIKFFDKFDYLQHTEIIVAVPSWGN